MATTPAKPPRKKPAKDAGTEPKHGKARKGAKKPKAAVAPLFLAGPSSVLRALAFASTAGLTDEQRAEIEARAKVVINLSDKIDGLVDSEKKLQTAIDDEHVSDPDRISAKSKKREAIAEREFCRTRIDQINRSGSFKDPGKTEEDKMLAAIDEVSRSTATATGILGLLEAVDNVVKSYKAQSTT